MLCGLALAACAARQVPAPPPAPLDAITLYRDRALVTQQVALVAVRAGTLHVAIDVAGGVAPDDITVVDAGGVSISSVKLTRGEPPPSSPVVEITGDTEPTSDAPVAAPPLPREPTPLVLTADVPRAGRFVITLGYATDRIAWDAAYTFIAPASRDRAVLRGALAIRNRTGVALRGHLVVVDGPLGPDRARAAAAISTSTPPAPAAPPPRRELGALALPVGETQLALVTGDAPRAMRSVLVYDPIGSQLDRATAAPSSDPELGTAPAAPLITESVEIARDDAATRGLPAGPVRLFAPDDDGALALLGEATLFEPVSRAARVDTIAIGSAPGLTGHRERRDWTKDNAQKRLSEELLITLDSTRPRPVDIVVREHLYRGLNWTLAYQSAPAAKEGPQQIALRTTVPANGRAKVLYVVVYTW